MWKRLLGFGVADVAGEVGEERAFRSDGRADGESFLEIEMCGVGTEAEGVDNEGIHIPHEVESFLGGFFDIRHVDEAISAMRFEEEAVGFDFTVADGEWRDFGAAEIERAVEAEGFGFEVAGVAVFAIECEGEHALDVAEGGVRTVDGDDSIDGDGEAAQFIEPGDVIHVGVGVENGVEFGDVLAEALEAEIGAGID